MVQTSKLKKSGASFVREYVSCIFVCLLVMLISLGLISLLISKGVIEESNSEYCAIMILLLSTITASAVALKGNAENKVILSLLVGAGCCIALLMITGIVFRGQYERCWGTVFAAMLGSILPIVVEKSFAKKNVKRRNRKRHR